MSEWMRPVLYPGEDWSWKIPEAAGFSSEKLEAFSDWMRGSGCIVHGGEMIHAWGDYQTPVDAGSSIKSMYAFLTFQAIEEGRIGSLDDRVAGWVPELGELNADKGFKDLDITFRHLLQQTSGYGLEEVPGEAFAYNDVATGLLAWVLVHRVYGEGAGEEDGLLNGDRLGNAIGFEDGPSLLQGDGKPGRIRISARDMARFALLCLRGGRWGEERLLGRAAFREAMDGVLPPEFPRTSGVEAEQLDFVKSIGGGKNEKHHVGCLGNFWWHNNRMTGGQPFLPDAPKRTFFSAGWGGRAAMVVVPEHDLVAVWLYVRPDERKLWSPLHRVGRVRMNEAIARLLEARGD